MVKSSVEILSEQRDADAWATAQNIRGIIYLDLNDDHPAPPYFPTVFFRACFLQYPDLNHQIGKK
jgi:hypothetical protein